jgi:hypothetical protein
MSANDNDKSKQFAGPVIITVHGTFAGNLRETPPHHWWQSEATLALQLIEKLGGAVVQPFKWKDKERTGPNRESERKIAGQQLFKQLLELEEKSISYHLVGHSHGGSVIWHALKESARAGKQLSGLKSWTTVATPFIEFGPDGSWLRHLLGAVTAIVALYLFGFWQLAYDLAMLAPQRNPQLIMDRLPLSNELSDLHAAVGDWLYYALLTGAAATALFFLVVILFPLKDLFHVLITYPRERRALKRAAGWYEPLWLGLLHPSDEAMAGLKATLIRAPDLVLRQRRGLAALLFAPLKPFARPVDEFAWSTLMKNAQGDDIVDEIVRRVATAPDPFSRGPDPLPAKVIADITARADAASATVLTRLRDRIGALSDQADVAALVAIMSGTYDEDSLIHTSMFDEPAVCGTIVAHIEATGTAKPEPVLVRSAAPPRALIWAKAMMAVAMVAIVAVLASAGYRILVYPETNLAAAEAILARFDDPAFQGLANDDAPGKAIVRAHRLGVPFDRAMSVAEKLEEKRTRFQAYRFLMRELMLANPVSGSAILLAKSPPKYVRSNEVEEFQTASAAAVLDALADFSPRTPSPDRSRMLLLVAQRSMQDFSGEPQRYLLARAIALAVALQSRYAATWMRRIAGIDQDCKSWNSIAAEAGALINDSVQAEVLNTFISACNLKSGAEDRQRLLRRIAVSALHSCEFAGPLMKEVSVRRAGEDAPVEPRFIECLAQDRKDAANALALESRQLLRRTSNTAQIREIWQMSQALATAGLTAEAAQWAETAVRFATEPDKQEEKERETVRQFNNDVLKLEILAVTNQKMHDAFIAELAKNADQFATSQGFSASWAALRYLNVKHADGSPPGTCSNRLRAIILASARFTEKNPSALVPVILSLADRCKIELHDGLLADIIQIVSRINVSTERAGCIAVTAPFQSNLRKAMATAETAALPPDILNGYVASVDRHRPRKQAEPRYNPAKLVQESASATEVRR